MAFTAPHRIRLLTCVLLLGCGSGRAAVFINELHYDNAGSDSGERIEIVATDGESLSGYRIHLYNGTSAPRSASVYSYTAVPAGGVTSCGGNVRIATVTYPRDGVQNGPNDAIALVDGSGAVVQFLAYEGSVTAGSGPAAGLTSSSLAVSEDNSTPAGTSLQLRGTGSGYDDFKWAASSAQSFGACNAGQGFSGGNPAPILLSTTPASGATGFPAAGDLEITFNEVVTASSGAFALACDVSGNVDLSHPASGNSFTLSTDTALHGGEHCVLSINATRISDSGGAHPGSDASVGFSVADGGGGDGDYYAHVNTSSPGQLRCSLHQTIDGHTVYPYSSSSGTSTWTILEIADEDPANPGRVLDAYRNHSYAKGSDRAGAGTGLKYNREHSWPNSLGFSSTSGDKGLPYAPYTDTHMLYLTDAAYNSDRGNKPYANCPASSNCGARATEANNGQGGGGAGDSNWVKGPDGNGGSFEVWNARKGDMARAVMYMAIRYEGGRDIHSNQSEPDLELTDDRNKIVKTSSSPAYMGLLSTLLAWHQADPPDAAERDRNEVIYSFQGNRNPFVDHPEWATQALFESTQPATCQLN